MDFEGYLRLGLPVGYGENASEAVHAMMNGNMASLFAQTRKLELEFGPGDVERASIEWLSFLRHIKCAPELDGNLRWSELKAAAVSELSKHKKRSQSHDLPLLPASMLQKPPQHRLSYSKVAHYRD